MRTAANQTKSIRECILKAQENNNTIDFYTNTASNQFSETYNHQVLSDVREESLDINLHLLHSSGYESLLDTMWLLTCLVAAGENGIVKILMHGGDAK